MIIYYSGGCRMLDPGQPERALGDRCNLMLAYNEHADLKNGIRGNRFRLILAARIKRGTQGTKRGKPSPTRGSVPPRPAR